MNPSFQRRFGAALVFSVSAPLLLAPAVLAAKKSEEPKGQQVLVEELRHGSRKTVADGTLVVFDKVHGLYMVPDRRHTYWIDGKFYEHEEGIWLTAKAVAGPWELATKNTIPDQLVGLHKQPLKKVTAKLPWGTEAVYEPRLKVYRVAGKKGVFLSDGYFLRYDNGVWFESKRDEGPWALTSVKTLPVALRKAVPPPADGSMTTLPSGEKLVYEKPSRTFQVEGKPELLYFDAHFYQRKDEQWQSSAKSDSGFVALDVEKVPAPIRAKFRGEKLRPGDKSKRAQQVKKEKPDKGAKSAKAGNRKKSPPATRE